MIESKLSDNEQAILMFIAVLILPITLWLTSPDPLFAETSLRILIAGILTGIVVFIKEIADYKPKSEVIQ